MKRTLTASLIAASLALGACSSSDDDDGILGIDNPIDDIEDGIEDGIDDITGEDDDDDDGDSDDADSATFQVTFTNLSSQLLTPPVVAIHDSSIHLFQVGEESSNAVQAIAEMGNNDPLVEFATDPDNAALVSAAGVAGDGPFGPGNTVVTSLTSDQADHVFSAVNMVICTNDGIAGFDSISLPEGTDPLTLVAVVYDAGTRQNQADAETFFPPPCRSGDVVEAPLEDPRQPIAGHPGQTGLTSPTEGPAAGLSLDFAASQQVLQVEIVRN